jgi:hypothetical protein
MICEFVGSTAMLLTGPAVAVTDVGFQFPAESEDRKSVAGSGAEDCKAATEGKLADWVCPVTKLNGS